MKKVLLALLFVPFFANAQIIETVVGTGAAGYSGDGGQATNAKINTPGGAVIDTNGNLYIADANNVIRKISTSGIISTVVGTGTSGYSGDGGPATNAQLNNPLKITIDKFGNLFIADYGNNRVRMVNASGVIKTIAGNGSAGFGGDGGQATSANLNNPTGVAVDRYGDVFIADYVNARVRKVTPSGIISTFAGNGTFGYGGDGGPATAAELNLTFGMDFDSSGNLLLADALNNRIRKISTTGIITTVAGNGTLGYSGDGGQATNAEMNNSAGIKVDNLGNMYISDQLNYRVRKVSAAGIISTIAGNGTSGYSGDGGTATAAEISPSNELTIDRSGKVYICDVSNHRIRVISSCAINISAQPHNDTVRINDTANYTVSVGTGFPSYQWQQNSGTGWINLSNSYPYFGVNTNTLRIANVPVALNHSQYRCAIANGGYCSDTSNVCSLIIRNTGVSQVNNDLSASVYPNPSRDVINILLPESNNVATIQLYDLYGQLLYETTSNNPKVTIDIKDQPTGSYTIRIQTNLAVYYNQITKY
jgi:hypothetical protein